MCAFFCGHLLNSTKYLNPAKYFCANSFLLSSTTFLLKKCFSYQLRTGGLFLARHFIASYGFRERPIKETHSNDIFQKNKAFLNATRFKVKRRMGKIIEKENILTVPNILSAARITFSPIIGHYIIQANFSAALYLTLFAGVTDLLILGILILPTRIFFFSVNSAYTPNGNYLNLDGVIARSWKNQSSKLGSFLDPMADKILIATMFLSLTYVELMPALLTSIIIGRDLILASAGFYIRYKSLPPPVTLSRYFDATHATVQLAPTFISKVNTMVQLFAVAITLAAPVMDFVGHPLIYYLWCLTGGSTIASAVSYLLSENTYIVMKAENKR